MGQCVSWDGGDNCPRIRHAIKHDDILGMHKLMEAGMDVDVQLDAHTGTTPLIMAAFYGAARVLPLVLDMGADPNICNKEGVSALDKAVHACALAHNLHFHKYPEEKRRYFILKVLVGAGCYTLNPADLETCINMNTHGVQGKTFLPNIVQIIAKSPSQRLKSDTLSVLIRSDVSHTHIKNLLLSGATFDNFLHSFRSSTWRTRRPLSNDVIMTIIRASSDGRMLHMMEGHYSCVMQSPRTPMPGSVSTLLYLAANPHKGPFSYDRPSRVSGATWRGMLADAPSDGPARLRHLCRMCVREHCVINVYYATQLLPLPNALIRYIQLESPS